MDSITVAIRNGLLFLAVVALVPAASYGVASSAYALTRASYEEAPDERVACEGERPDDTVCD